MLMPSVAGAAAALAGAVGALLLLGSPSQAAVPVERPVQIVNVKTGKCLTIAGGTSDANSLPTVQFDCDNHPSRRWIIHTGLAGYQIKNLQTGKCLTIEGGTLADNNRRTVQYNCDDDLSRRWLLSGEADGYQIKNVKTEKCATIAGGTLSDNNIEGVQFDCDDDPSRRWTIRAVSAAATPPPPAYRTSNWSPWSRTSGIEYRYRWGWNPADAHQIDAIFEIHNLQNQIWRGAARTIACETNTLWGSRNVDLGPSERREVTFRTPNCGSAANPLFKPSVVQSSTL
jgi:hypothetical protein